MDYFNLVEYVEFFNLNISDIPKFVLYFQECVLSEIIKY